MSLKKEIQIFLILLIFSILLAVVLGSMFSIHYGNTMIIPIKGEITMSGTSSLFTSISNGDDILEQIDQAAKNPNVKAVILDINSPGGTVVAVEQIVNKLKELNKTKVALIRETGASGAYWIASAADKIVADQFSILGSIGVTASYLEYSGLMERFNVSYVRIVSGEHKDIGSPYKKPTEKELTDLQDMVNAIHEKFVSDISKNRNLDINFVKNISDGSIFLGEKAKELGLIDYLGGKETAFNVTKEIANLTEIIPFEAKKKIGLFDLISMLSSLGTGRILELNKISLNVAYP
ncbi:MAG: signal peptide peptidase SppA [Candidatus Parvarchaeota archaeon]|nr:signal peptide peptidase SppA [Candidatus Jingweiarchaeum tengchongense]MCW1298565.1 signal peptide peptidase SppA [Candidatus Jingweiarchaeum tengchongense]MCW1304588.1 signal peptide peptidase SppA [Candidatus Jingweiarchaeum tengchongense]MCW1309175.1 signal peptide peptidase SppA [Candidatus Jingweiarchaeum tengchongense]MCW1310260.1 signal peptide peptidase SppA [Candidatus Jingweiarchaeum tengchongense]